MKLEVVRVLGNQFAFICLALATQAIAAPKLVQGTIAKVVDGDTVHVRVGSSYRALADNFDLYANPVADANLLKIRMLGIDSAETHFPAPGHGVVGQQPWGDEAADYLNRLVKVGGAITLQTWGLDKYKRTLGFVFSNKVDINLQMVRGGFAAPYEICSGPDCTRQFFTDYRVRDYLMSCDAARKEKRGIWNPSRPLNELPFEFRMRMTNGKPEKYVGNYDTMELLEPQDYKRIDICRRVFFLNKNEALRIGFKQK